MSICATAWLVAHLWSTHYRTDQRLNNDNFGGGVECRLEASSWSAQGGGYANSFGHRTLYAGAGYELLQGSVRGRAVSAGAFAAYATGYNPRLAAGLRGSIALTDTIELGVMTVPPSPYNGVFHLTISWRFK